FATQGWDKLRHSLERRHSITHPKTPTELAISDIDLDVCKDGFAWFLETCNEFHSALLRKYVD
ncbi:MAG TPA: hypothetical protein VIU63_08280, partial [Nitrospira sp.]